MNGHDLRDASQMEHVLLLLLTSLLFITPWLLETFTCIDQDKVKTYHQVGEAIHMRLDFGHRRNQ